MLHRIMQYTGVVTRFELEYCVFILDRKITVYAGYLFANSDKIIVPCLHETVTLQNVEFYKEKIIFLKLDSIILCNQYCTTNFTNTCLPFIELIKLKNLNCLQILSITKQVDFLNKYMSFPPAFLQKNNLNMSLNNRQIVFDAIPYLNIKSRNIFEDCIKILTPKNHRLESNKSSNSKSYYSFGVNFFPDTECLIAYLTISPNEGYTVLRDNKIYFPCVIASGNRTNLTVKLSKLLNNLVLIQNYYIFTEFTQGYHASRYIFVNIDDIHDMNWKLKLENKLNSGFYVKIKVTHRATVNLDKNPNCWIICEILHSETNKYRSCCLRIFGKQFDKYPLFNDGDEYKMFTNFARFVNQIKTFTGERIYKVDGESLPVFYVPNDAEFELIINKNETAAQIAADFSLMSVEDVNDALILYKNRDLFNKLYETLTNKTTQQLFSFEAVIDKKNFLSPYGGTTAHNQYDSESNNVQESSNQTKKPPPAFGIPGPQIHQLTLKIPTCGMTRGQYLELERSTTLLRIYASEFNNDDDIDKCYLNSEDTIPEEISVRIFMHNWDSLQVPMGLIPGMQVAVRMVLINKTYFKPTFMTRIEPLYYKPLKLFNTCYESIGNTDWGPTTSLSDSSHIPSGCLCWGPVLTIKITTLNLKYLCSVCKKEYTYNQDTCCEYGTPEHSFLFVLKVRDTEGLCDIIGKDDEVLRVILGLRKDEWKLFLRGFWALKCFSLKKEPEQEQIFESHQKNFAQTLENIIKIYNDQMLHQYDMKCRKLSKASDDKTEKWFIIETRLTEPRNLFMYS